jgi:hypothetical protein
MIEYKLSTGTRIYVRLLAGRCRVKTKVEPHGRKHPAFINYYLTVRVEFGEQKASQKCEAFHLYS